MQTATDLIVPLNQLARDELARAGGKAANLGAMLAADLPVPPGFCITADAYREVAGVLTPAIRSKLDGLDVDDNAALEAAAAAVRAEIEALVLPEQLASAIRDAYAALPRAGGSQTTVAVRSSATAEDLPDASFAGQQDSYLNVRGADLVDAVRRCWASLWTARAIAYRRRNGFADDSVALAVVVQQMVDAGVSGVLFTADPLSGNRTRMLVNAAWGLGEAIVGGIVAPDTWTLDESGRVIEQQLGDKQRMVVYAPDGGTTIEPVPAEHRNSACLTADELERMATLGRAAAQFFGAPQDIEWALADGQLYLLQSRPITTLFPLPEPRPVDDTLHVYVSVNALQGIIEPLTPMGIDVFREIALVIQSLTGLQLMPRSSPGRMVSAAGRLYVDATAALRHPIGRHIVSIPFRMVDPGTLRLFPRLFADPRLAPSPLDRIGTLRTVAKLVWRARRLVRRALRTLRRPDRERPQAIATVSTHMQKVEQLARRPMSLADRRMAARSVAVGAVPVVLRNIPPVLAPAMASWLAAEMLVRRWGLPPELLLAVRQGVPHNPTTEMDLQLWHVAQAIKGDLDARAEFDEHSADELATTYLSGELPPVAQREIAGFLERYGHRAVREIDAGMPRWSDAPGYLMGAIRNYMLLDDPAAAPDRRFEALASEAEQARTELVRVARAQRGGLFKGTVLGLLTGRMRALLGVREQPKFWLVKTMALIREVLYGAGEELQRDGALERAEDVFFLKLDEVEHAAAGDTAALRALVAERRAAYEREMRRRQPPKVITSEGEILTAAAIEHSADQLSGIGVSPGVYQGRVRVIQDPHGARLEPGEILVAPSTDPAWTPLFLTAGGLVMEAGGILSHGSVVAREYGIPAVVGVSGATDLLHTGRLVRIDGTAGTVTLIEGS